MNNTGNRDGSNNTILQPPTRPNVEVNPTGLGGLYNPVGPTADRFRLPQILTPALFLDTNTTDNLQSGTFSNNNSVEQLYRALLMNTSIPLVSQEVISNDNTINNDNSSRGRHGRGSARRGNGRGRVRSMRNTGVEVASDEETNAAVHPYSSKLWNNDAVNGGPTSESVLLDWLTTQGNYDRYTGDSSTGESKEVLLSEIQQKLRDAGITWRTNKNIRYAFVDEITGLKNIQLIYKLVYL